MMQGVRGCQIDSLRFSAGNNTFFLSLSLSSHILISHQGCTHHLTLIASPPHPQTASSCYLGAATPKATFQNST